MPTEEQLSITIESSLEFFGGSGLPKQNFHGSSDGHGFTTEKNVDAPLVSKTSSSKSKGTPIGRIVLDTKTRYLDLEITNRENFETSTTQLDI